MIDKDWILKKAIYVEFPCKKGGILTYINKDDDSVLKMPNIDMTFKTYALNGHHFDAQYHFEYVLPFFEKQFHFGFKMTDFKIIKNLVQGKYDISNLYPIDDSKTFTVESINFQDLGKNEGKYNILSGSSFAKTKMKNVNDYHWQYCLPHTISIINNNGKSNGKTMLLIGDSQTIPDVPVIAYYYKTVIYVDNRNNINWMNKISDYNVNDVVIQMWDKSKQLCEKTIK